MPSFKEKLRNKECIGVLQSIDSADIAEILALAGFDWLFIDLEHSTLSPEHLKDNIRAAKSVRSDCAVIARVPLNDTIWIKRVLDSGCDGVIIPQVNSAAEAKLAVDNSKYRPLGTRGVGIGRAQGFGQHLQDYIASANQEVLTIIQIEHIDAIQNIDSILDVEGIDAIFIGPYDLSDSMGLRGEVNHPKVKEAIAKVQSKCDATRIPSGIFVGNADAAKTRIGEGFKLIAMSTDALYLAGAAKDALKTLKS